MIDERIDAVTRAARLVVEIYNNGPVTNEDGDEIDLDTAVDFLNRDLELLDALADEGIAQ